MRWLLLLLLIPAVQAVETIHEDGRTWEAEWGEPAWVADAQGTLVQAIPVHTGNTTYWLEAGMVGMVDSAQASFDDGHLVSGLNPDDFTARTMTPAAMPCVLVLRPQDTLTPDCTIGDRLVPAGTPVADLQATWDGDRPRLVYEGHAAEALGEGPRPVADGGTKEGPAWHVDPPRPWGPVAMDGPREAAYEWALLDPTLGLATWSAGRDMWPQEGSTSVVADGVQELVLHRFVITDGEETFAFGVRDESGIMEAFLYEPPPAVAPRPDAWPTVPTLSARLAHHADDTWRDVEATRWGYEWDDGWIFQVAQERHRLVDGQWHHDEIEAVFDEQGALVSLRDLRPHGEAFRFTAGSPGTAPDTRPETVSMQEAAPQPPTGLQGTAVALAAILILASIRWIAVPLFTRLRQDRLLEHPLRRQIMDHIEESGSIHFSALARATGIPNGSLVHHLRMLEQGGLVRARKTAGYTFYTPSRTEPWHRFLPFIQSANAKAIVRRVAAGACTVQELAVDAPEATVRWHLRRLVDGGVLVRVEGPKGHRYHVAPDALGLPPRLPHV